MEEGKTGRLYRAGDTAGLQKGIEYFINHPAQAEQLGQAARRIFEEKYSKALNYETLIKIYQVAINNVK